MTNRLIRTAVMDPEERYIPQETPMKKYLELWETLPRGTPPPPDTSGGPGGASTSHWT